MRIAVLVLVLCVLGGATQQAAAAVGDDIRPLGSFPLEAHPPRNMAPTTSGVDYPLYKQCDTRWANDVMGSKTICQVGCLMSSVSMGLAGHAIPISGETSTPHTLNEWLRENGGYAGDDLKESVVPAIDPDRITWVGSYIPQTKVSRETIKEWIDGGTRVVIANVMHGHHFVLVNGYDESLTDFHVNDPGFDITSYSYDEDIVGWRIFDMTDATKAPSSKAGILKA